MEIINAVGRRKTAVARAFVQTGNGKITINKRDFENYFPVESLQQIVRKPFRTLQIMLISSTYTLTLTEVV